MSFAPLIDAFLTHCRVRQYTARTIEDRREQLRGFATWCAERDITSAAQLTPRLIERYQHHLYHYRKRNGEPLSPGTQAMRLVAVRVFCRYLAKHNHVPVNPAADVELPKRAKRLPRHVLTPSDVEQVMKQVDTRDILGIRDRAILEVLYSTGMRRLELMQLTLADLDLANGTVLIREGKGTKDRVVPIGSRAIAWLTRYLEDVRPHLALIPDDGIVFRLHTRRPLTAHWLSATARHYINAADLGKKGSCHLLRHSMATAMLENGADIRYIQAILGHEDLATTQIYTQVSIAKLKEVHTRTHPAKLVRVIIETPDDDAGDA